MPQVIIIGKIVNSLIIGKSCDLMTNDAKIEKINGKNILFTSVTIHLCTEGDKMAGEKT